MLRYAPVNLIPALRRSIAPMMGDLTPLKPEPPAGLPSWGVNLVIMGTGVAMALVAYPYKKKPVGDLLVHAGGSIAGIGLIFTILDASGFRPGNL
jgi:hypothetical protein